MGNGTKKRTAKTVLFVALTWCQASDIGLPVGTRKDALRCFSIQPFNADGVASKTHFASVTSFRFHCGVRPKEAQTLGNGTKKGTAKTVLFVALTWCQASEIGLPVGTRTRNNAVGGHDFIQLDYG